MSTGYPLMASDFVYVRKELHTVMQHKLLAVQELSKQHLAGCDPGLHCPCMQELCGILSQES